MSSVRCIVLSLVILCWPLLALAGEAVPYRLDPVHSRVMFSVMHDGYSKVIGTFAHPEGTLWFDPDDWSRAKVDVRIDLATLDLGDADFNARIARGDYLDAKDHPQAHFVSQTVEGLSKTEAKVHGLLRLRGEQTPVTLDVTLNRIARSAWSLRRTVGFSATATLSRAALGMSKHRSAVGDKVELRIEVEAVRTQRSATDGDL
ncbi:MAG: polyisoprenoid-binding protein [Xanthomonadales bacterium]|jgi:polyisoprenoid-binding protein YceI|nr:polyisoprenoid-binding protein [Xanthomonadales bacterium]